VQAPEPEQAPVHVTKVDPDAGFAVKDTELPVGKLAVHLFPQSMPLGALVTVPVPVPRFSTRRVDTATVPKMAVTD
jgi:hypothetical protein